MDQRPTIDSTKEMGTADFSNIISGIHNESELKGYKAVLDRQENDQRLCKSIMLDNSGLHTDRIGYAHVSRLVILSRQM